MKLKIIILFHFCLLTLISQEINVLIDEDYSDWDNINPIYTDSTGDQTSGEIDFGRLWFVNDQDYLYFRIETGGEINLQDLNQIKIYIDTDNSSSTGYYIFGIGAELVYSFGGRTGSVKVGGNVQTIYHDDIGLISSPTVTSDDFEFVIDRNIKFFNVPLFSNNIIKAVFYDEGIGKDRLPDENGGIMMSLSTGSHGPLPEYSISKYDNTEHIRIISYNVETDGLFDSNNAPHFKNILKALEPEIIGFEEIYNHTAQETAALIESILPSANSETWYYSKINPDIVLISRFNILSSHNIDGNGAFLLNLSPAYDSKMLLIVAHPPCCANNIQRQLEIDAIMAFIRNAKNPGGNLTLPEGTPIMITGDLNLVGDVQQRNTLLTGDIVNENIYGPDFTPDWDGTDLKDLKPYTTNLPMTFSWYDLANSFSPGRLDYIIYTNSIIEMINSFVLFTPSLEIDTLSTYNLQSQDAILASDHLPVVSDFRLNIPTQVISEHDIMRFNLGQNYPNPFNSYTTINFTIPSINENEKYNPSFNTILELFDITGRRARILLDKTLTEGKYEIVINASGLVSGVYLYRLRYGRFTETRKLLYLK